MEFKNDRTDVRQEARRSLVCRAIRACAVAGDCLGLCSPASASIRHHHAGRVALGGGMTDPAKDAALIIDGATGKILYARNADATVTGIAHQDDDPLSAVRR